MEMSSNNESNDPYEEVRKLQSLVQKLEFQNEQLKSQVKEEKTKTWKDRRSKSIAGYISDNGLKQLNLSSLDFETNGLNPKMEEFIDIDQLELSDDDSWLYMPPKGLTTEDSSLNPYKWLRKDLEDPENKELQLAKSALVNKLEELSILSPLNQEADAELQEDDCSENVIPTDQTRIIDTRTFTRSKKKKISKEEELDPKVPFIEPLICNTKNGDIDDDSNYEFGYIRPELYQLSDFIDVHEKARMQEESLRQSTPVIPGRGSCSLPRTKKLPNGNVKASRSSSSDTEDSYGNNIENAKKYIHRPMTSTPANTMKTFNSTHSSPLGSNSSLNNTTAPSSLRRSLPNLAKSNVSRRSTPTKPTNNLKTNRHGFTNHQQNMNFPSQARRESAPSPSFRKPIVPEPHSYSANAIAVQSTPNFYKSGLVPSNRGQTRSGLPRPSKLPTSRPKLPVPLYHPKKTQVEETWSDGCF